MIPGKVGVEFLLVVGMEAGGGHRARAAGWVVVAVGRSCRDAVTAASGGAVGLFLFRIGRLIA